jgi:hypothetical protein
VQKTIEVTGLSIRDFGGNLLSGVIVFTASAAEVADPADEVLNAGSATGLVTAGVMGAVTLPTTDSVSPGFTYTIRQQLATADGEGLNIPPVENVAIPSTLGSTVDLSALV